MKKTINWLHIGYLDDGYKMNSLYIMLPKRIAYVKSYNGKTKWMYFLIKNYYLLKNIMIFGIKSAIVREKNLIASQSTVKSL